jgi:valyl-tRNA synthetase
MSTPPPTTPTPIAQPGAALMAKAYVPSEHEPRIREAWEREDLWRADPSRVDHGASPTHQPGAARPGYCILIPPPNVTGALHLGHALNNTIQDILCRWRRMQGYEVLWMPGTDHAGIATQAVVEKRLWAEEKKRRADFTREQFIARVQAWKDEYEARITDQLRAMGCSCDWSRQRFTMDPICAKAVREAFFILFRDGLIVRGKRLVNWDPILQTAVADDECYEQEVPAAFYYVRYPLVRWSGGSPREAVPVTWGQLAERGYPGAADHPGGMPAWVTVATTRPETYLGDTAVAISQHDPRAAALRGLWARLPIIGRIVPIIEDTSGYVVLPRRFARTDEERSDPKAEFATGFLKVTPAHDPNDYELGQRYAPQIRLNSAGKVMINIMTADGRIGVDDLADLSDNASKFFVQHFLDKKMLQTADSVRSPSPARKAVLEALAQQHLDATDLPFLESQRPYTQTLKFSDRSRAVIEPYLSDQWFCRVTDDRLAGAASRATEAGLVRFHPPRYTRTYEQWHAGIRDWCISRQLWWGHRIPVWSSTAPQKLTVSEEEFLERRQRLAAEGRVWFSTSPNTGSSDHERDLPTSYACVRDEHDTEAVQFLESNGYVRDPDVLDTWFSSALWPLSTMGWPNPEAHPQTAGLLRAFNPTSVLSTAREIITLWVSRMVMMNRYLLPAGFPEQADLSRHGRGEGPAPFRDVFIHAVVQDGEGRRMSKSAGNGVDPLDIIQSHGADALRFTLCQMTTQTQDVRMPVQKDPRTGRNTSPRFDLGRNFCNKLWNASRYVQSILAPHAATGALQAVECPADLPLVDRWMLSRLAGAVRRANEALERFEFADYAECAYDLLWRDFCDLYLEAIKPSVGSSPTQRTVLRASLETILRLLHPVMPFVTQAVHEHLAMLPSGPVRGLTLEQGPTLPLCPWPIVDDALADAEAEERFGRVKQLISAINAVRAQHNVPARRRITLHASENLARIIKDGNGAVETLAGLAQVLRTPPPAGVSSALLVLEGEQNALSNLADHVDEGTELERLGRERAEELKKIATLEGRLSNPGYIERAPARLVEETRSQLSQAKANLERIEAALRSLE